MEFKVLSTYFQKLEFTSSRNQMTEILSELFKKANADEIDKICYLLQGRVVPLFVPLEFGVAEKMMIKALAQAYQVAEAEVVAIFKKEGDLGNTAQVLISNIKYQKSKIHIKNQNLSANEVYEQLYKLAITTGEGSVEKKIEILSSLLQSVDPLSARYIVRIPLSKLRLGFSDMTILDALSWVLSGSKKDRPEIEKGYNVRPDLGFIAKTIKEGQEGKGGLEGLEKIGPEIGTPILMARAERLTSGEEIIEKIGQCALEPKFDGFRLQVHYSQIKDKGLKIKDRKKEEGVKLFSRNLEDVTPMYPDIVKGVVEQVKADEAIFEGEAIAFDPKTGRFLPFQETVQRKRKYDIEKKALEVPLKLMAFDLLYVNGENLIEKPYKERRKRLEGVLRN